MIPSPRRLCRCYSQNDTSDSEQNSENTLVAHTPPTRNPAEHDDSAGLDVTSYCRAYRPGAGDDEDLGNINKDSTDGALFRILAPWLNAVAGCSTYQ